VTRLVKFHFLSDTTKGQQLDCIALLETCRANYTYMDKVNTQFCSQILFRATHWIRFWASRPHYRSLLSCFGDYGNQYLCEEWEAV